MRHQEPPVLRNSGILDPPHQFQHRDFWPCAEPNGGTGGSDATVDVQLAVGFLVPSANLGSFRAYEGEAPVDK